MAGRIFGAEKKVSHYQGPTGFCEQRDLHDADFLWETKIHGNYSGMCCEIYRGLVSQTNVLLFLALRSINLLRVK